ncbi:unnamed protein product [Effrenium voratum]|nr:unnamed protein product [Effrenium voratum]
MASEWNRAISSFARSSKWRDALLLFEAAQHAVQIDVVTVTSVMAACRWRLSLQLLQEHLPLANVITYTTLMRACNKEGEWQNCLLLFNSLLEMSFQTDLILHSAAVTACERGSLWQEALVMIGSLRLMSLLPDSIIFNATISACEKAAEWQWALHLLCSLHHWATLPSVVTFAAVVSSCGNATQWRHALHVLTEAKSASVSADAVLCNAAISACGADSQWRLTRDLLTEMERRSLPSQVTLNACITASENWCHGVKLLGLFDRWKLQKDVVSFNAAISRDAWPVALELSRETALRGLPATVVTWTAAATAASDSPGAAGAAGAAWRRALRLAMAPAGANELSFEAAIRSCALAQRRRS